MTQDWVGLYNEYYNTVYSNAPPSMRKKAPMDIIKVYDNAFAPITQEFMPRMSAPSIDGKPISIRSSFKVPITANPGVMASFADTRDKPISRTVAFREESYSPSLIHEDGPEWNPLEFADEWDSAFINHRNQYRNVMAVQAIDRLVEYSNIRYLWGDSEFTNRFSPTVNMDRKKVIDLSSTDDAFTGKTWSDLANSDIVKDISTIKYLSREIPGGSEVKYALIGNKTAWSIENSTKIRSELKYTRDLTNTIIGTQLGGVTFKVVSDLDYKDAAASSTAPGHPGAGDVRPTTWATDSRTRFLTHEDGGNTFEWALFMPGNIGSTFTARVNPKQTDTNQIYVHSWKDEETEIVKTRMQLGFTPFVDDWGKFFVVKKMAQR